MDIIIKVLALAVALLFTAWVLPGIEIDGFLPAVWAALIMGLINVFIRPVLIFLTIPINILTLGLFTFVINALLFLFTASIVDGFEVNGFMAALLGSIFLSVMSVVINRLDI
jgi:putative membrane protein